MNKILVGLALTFSLGFSQDTGGMNEDKMQAMMQEMQKMQVCMSKIDMSSLQAMQTEAITLEKQIKQMCESGQRDKAQQTAVKYSKKIMTSPAMLQMKECTKSMPMMNMEEDDFERHHICDGEKIELGDKSNQRISW